MSDDQASNDGRRTGTALRKSSEKENPKKGRREIMGKLRTEGKKEKGDSPSGKLRN